MDGRPEPSGESGAGMGGETIPEGSTTAATPQAPRDNDAGDELDAATLAAAAEREREVEKERDEEVSLELKVLEAIEIYPPGLLNGVHRHIILYGLCQFLSSRVGRPFTSQEVLELLGKFYSLDRLPAPDGGAEFGDEETEFALPQGITGGA